MVEPIAIIGMGCRFPGASDVQEFWQLMCNGVDAITEVPRDRFDVQDFYHPQPRYSWKNHESMGGFLDQIDHFDAAFFGSLQEKLPVWTRSIDCSSKLPGKRWKMLDRFQTSPLTQKLAFLLDHYERYWDRQFRNPIDLDVYSTAGSARSGAAGRISYATWFARYKCRGGCSLLILTSGCASCLSSLRSWFCNLALAGVSISSSIPTILLAILREK